MEYGGSIGMRWETSLTKDNCSWEAPGHLSSLQSDDARTAMDRAGLSRVKKLQTDTGCAEGEYAYRVYFEDIGSGDFKIYFLIG
jgi:acetyl-CoA acetyltransferase